MKIFIFKLRSKIANMLIKLAFKIRPKLEKDILQSIQDQMIYGTGVNRIDPKDMFL